MVDLKRLKKNRSKNSLFNPYKNGLTSYDLAYLSSKNVLKSKQNFKKNSSEEYMAA